MAPRKVQLGGEFKVNDLRESLKSGSSVTRVQALDNLIYFFSRKDTGNRSQSQDQLGDKSYHTLFEGLFHATLAEKKTFLSGKGLKNLSPSRLSKCAEALRTVVAHGAPRIKRKTAKAVIDHITQTLLGRDDDFLEPLVPDYIKALVSLLESPPIVEGLTVPDVEGWTVCADFCLDVLSRLSDTGERDAGTGSRASPGPGTAHTSSAVSTGRSIVLSSQRSTKESSRPFEAVLRCILSLVSASNAPILMRYKEISSAVIQILQSSRQSRFSQGSGLRSWHQPAFAVLNCILSRTRGDDLAAGDELTRQMIPLLNYWWLPRAQAADEGILFVRDEMLKSMYEMHLHIANLSRSPTGTSILEDLEELLEGLWHEYSHRDDRSRLQLDDITFTSLPFPDDYLRTGLFSLRPYHVAAERRWALVELLALMEAVLRSSPASSAHSSGGEDQPRKKRRINNKLNRIHLKLVSPDKGIRSTALQIVPFLLTQINLSTQDVSEMVEDLVTFINDKQGLQSSWAMIACASCASLPSARDPSVEPRWKQIWHLAIRSVSIPSASRAACVLLHAMLESNLVPLDDIAEDISNVVTSADISGPAVLSDASLVLMLHLIHLRNSMLPSASQKTSLYIIRWVFSKWSPADALFSSLHSNHVGSVDLCNLLRACYGMSRFEVFRPVPIYGGPISQAWKAQRETNAMVRYLLLLDEHDLDKRPRLTCALSSGVEQIDRDADDASFHAAKKLTLELFYPKLEELVQSYETGSRQGENGPTQLSIERLQSLISCCVTGAILLPQLESLDSRMSKDIVPLLFGIVDSALGSMLESPESQMQLDLVRTIVAPLLPPLDTAILTGFHKASPYLIRLFAKISAIDDERTARQSSKQDSMDVDDDDFDSQGSQRNSVAKLSSVPRQVISLSLHQAAFQDSTNLQLHYLAILEEDPGQIGLLPATFVERLLSMPSEDFLLCRDFVKSLLASDLQKSIDNASRLLETIGGIISANEFSTSEVALCMCIDIIQGLMPLWCHDSNDISDMVGDLYSHLFKTALPNNTLSPTAQLSLAQLLYELLAANPQYARSLDLPSCRSALLSILRDGVMMVKFYIGLRLPRIFELFVLKTHDDIFVDVLENLPADPEMIEGLAFRLFVLAELACRCPTLLRRCVYHIFEAPGKIARCADYATYCLATISKGRALSSPQELFQLFAPQLLYTWLETDSIEDIPYAIFGYSGLEELLEQARTEAVALMIMRNQDDALPRLAENFQATQEVIVQEAFAKVMAYSIAHDFSSKEHQTTGESRIKRILGRDKFHESLYINFADIVGIFLDIFDQEDPIEKYFRKEQNLDYAADIMDKIKTFGHSDITLPPNQQPLFKAKYLSHCLTLLCSRTEHDMASLWTSPMVVSVARRLINTVHPALGPLHACSVIRKLRVLVSMAGSVATSSYPLEMLLHSIRPFIQNVECADDALGLTQYLIASGGNHLKRSPSFAAGYALSTLASLRMFLESSQASTTQESQFKATMSKAQQFHSWLTQYLSQYDSSAFKSEDQKAAFRSIMQSAAQIRSSGNAEKDTAESNLLLEILKDSERDDQLLNEPARNLVLEMLCSDFRPPESGHMDIIQSDEDAQVFGAVVWKSCQARNLSNEYLTWAGRVVGRSFASTGELYPDVLRESRLAHYRKVTSNNAGSEQGLLNLLETLTMDDDTLTAGLAESTLRNIVTEATAQQDPVLLMACQKKLAESLFLSSDWSAYRAPPSDTPSGVVPEFQTFTSDAMGSKDWPQGLAIFLAQGVEDHIVLSVLTPILEHVKGFAEQALPFILHLVLLAQLDREQTAKVAVSGRLESWLTSTVSGAKDNIKLLINSLLYLQMQPFPNETTIADRSRWLDVDYTAAAGAATRCGMFKVALLFTEAAAAELSRSSRRSSASRDKSDPSEALLAIFENIDDPDAYYGLDRASSLSNVLSRLEYEHDGSKSLAFRGAQFDSHIRGRSSASDQDGQALVKALSSLGLAGISHSLLQNHQNLESNPASMDSTFTSARRLEIWDLPVPPVSDNHAITTYRAYQSIHKAVDLALAKSAVHDGLSTTIRNLTSRDHNSVSLRSHLGTLASLSELSDILNVNDFMELDNILATFDHRSEWMMSGRYTDVSQILSCRQTSLSMISQKDVLRSAPKLTPAEARLAEIRGLLLSSSIYRYHRASQESLNLSTSLTDLIGPSEAVGLLVEAAIKIETANSLWDYGEMIPSIRMLQGIDKESSLKKQNVPVSRSNLLSKIGHQVSVARLEGPDVIQKRYLEPALKELKGEVEGKAAGQVFHQFAKFCDEQLQNPDGLEDLARLQGLKKRKSDEVAKLEELLTKEKDDKQRAKYKAHLQRDKQWLDLDHQELRRVEQTRSEFVRLSLENYLLSLKASDENNNDALRFTALWLERSDEGPTNEAVKKYLDRVPTRKFASLMNQLTSRLQTQSTPFQKLLINLVFRICVDHPYHGMYQIWSGVRARSSEQDEIAISRRQATERVAKQIEKTNTTAPVWRAIDKTSRQYHILAIDRDKEKYKSNRKIAVKDSTAGQALLSALLKYRIPPPTMQLELATDLDYTNVPFIAKVEPMMSIAGGISAPKIITVVATNGERYKQLVKGGNDDLRQDAIMEQVFAAVSSLLKSHRATRQRNLGIRTYKVLPLTATTGLIEFVDNTIPLHEYLIPAHEKYYPKDWTGSACRKEISQVQHKSIETRVSTYKRVTQNFHPVMRYFFMENFPVPDEWYLRRLAYTRSTAAVSILGHVLGLGDRHGHNILLDAKTGEAVHIDLGVAFEMGRVLPIPELVPFRLTRDIVDGMGITKTEGVFRRCCEFTLDALREDTYSIMTILDVLRYDPLYSWSISPVRLAKLQDARRTDEGEVGVEQSVVENRKVVNEPSEADRALEVVRKKLSKTLSVTATVNDLINQATDERNLAVLFAGWAAYA